MQGKEESMNRVLVTTPGSCEFHRVSLRNTSTKSELRIHKIHKLSICIQDPRLKCLPPYVIIYCLQCSSKIYRADTKEFTLTDR